jgi:hypothetical protein
MEWIALIEQLAANAGRIQALVEGVGPEQARWKPDAGTWSILEVINHLYDEEREDFRPRLESTLLHLNTPWRPIDPQGWVTERSYNERDLPPCLQGFLQERQASLAWLRGLGSPDWEAHYLAPWGPMRAGDLLASWAGHDLLHMRQLVELHRAHVAWLAGAYSLEYAGPWEEA